MHRCIAERNLAAEVRGVECGHRAIVLPGGAIKVVSDTHHGKHYVVTFAAASVGGRVAFTCTPHGSQAYRDDHLTTTSRCAGLVPCMHAAIAARRLERERLIDLNDRGEWIATPRAAIAQPAPVDPFAVFSGR